jgi:hypothetical protein
LESAEALEIVQTIVIVLLTIAYVVLLLALRKLFRAGLITRVAAIERMLKSGPVGSSTAAPNGIGDASLPETGRPDDEGLGILHFE